MIKDLLIQLKEYTEEQDAFETQSERDMERELENKLDKDIQKAEKEKVKYIIQMICMLDNIQKEVDFTYYHKHKHKVHLFHHFIVLTIFHRVFE